MAGGLYDYIIAITIVGIIFISVVLIAPSLSYVNLLYIDQQQLRSLAMETLKTILLGTGYPGNWGSQDPFDPSGVQNFGLASTDSSSFYVLDPDKVQRLVEDNPIGYIEYPRMRKLLGLERYGFNIRIVPPFNFTILNAQVVPPHISFEVKVSLHDGRPIPNGKVNAVIFYTTQGRGQGQGDKGEERSWVFFEKVDDKFTDARGICGIERMLTPPGQISDVMVLFTVTVADLVTLFVTYQSIRPDDIAKVNMVSDNVTLSMPDNPPSPPNDDRWVDNVIMFSLDTGTIMFLYNGSRLTKEKEKDMLNYGSYKVWTKTFCELKYHNPALLIFNFWAVDIGENPARRSVLIAGPYPNWLGYRVIEYGGTSPQGYTAVKLYRNVVVSGMTFNAELALWKES